MLNRDKSIMFKEILMNLN